jgi:transcriptional regulator with XRE-family HTH domain
MTSPQNNRPMEIRRRSSALDAHVGTRIRAHRKGARMTLQVLADKLGIAYQQLQKYETGINRVGAGRLMEIAEILNIPVASFFVLQGEGTQETLAPNGSGAAAGAGMDATLQGHSLLISFLRIKDHSKRKQALAYVRALAEPEKR